MENQEIKYGIGVQSFEKLRRQGNVYVDKTGFIPKLLQNNYFFLGRPRRFGKSLFLSMLDAYFSGKKELFEGLEISKWEKSWTKYPVVHIDFTTFDGSKIDSFMADLKARLGKIAHDNDLALPIDENGTHASIGPLFGQLVVMLAQKYNRKVVILIDEYDKFFLDVSRDERKLEEATLAMRPFFSVLKSMDEYIQFGFITGVARFRSTTLFSGANNLWDISMESEFATMFGITKDELVKYFKPGIEAIQRRYGWSWHDTLSELENKYDGYRFTKADEYVYNPFSVLSVMRSGEFNNYWATTGISKMLKEYLVDSHFRIDALTDNWVSTNVLGAPYSSTDPTSLLFQSGYLTIDDTKGFGLYKLKIPNEEVQATLAEIVLPYFVKEKGDGAFANCRAALYN